ncbi:MAG: NADH-quinone oxidoreductase subunit J [Betaproteobacteria bacterium]|nr:NADH-quinone oxidoreductase subunit J [Betaproteobacteria bacterium]
MPELQGILFYLFAALLLAAGAGVVTMRNPVHCALLLVVAFVAAAVLWLLLGAEFLAIVLVLVYVGAVMVLFLFVVMMLDINFDRLREGFWNYLPVGLVVAAGLGVQMYLVANSGLFDLQAHPNPKSYAAGESNTAELGRILYTDYLLAFEAAAVILLVAIVAAIVLTLRRRKENKSIDPAVQVAVDPAQRVRVLQIEAVKPVESAAGEDAGKPGKQSDGEGGS